MDPRPCYGIVSVSFETLWDFLLLLSQSCNIKQLNIDVQLEDRELKQPPLRGSWSLCPSSRL